MRTCASAIRRWRRRSRRCIRNAPSADVTSASIDRKGGEMGPLVGLRIVELASIGPGPMCAMLLADLGADVVRVDRLEPSGLGVGMANRFEVCARNRRSLALDLKRNEARDIVLRLVD